MAGSRLDTAGRSAAGRTCGAPGAKQAALSRPRDSEMTRKAPLLGGSARLGGEDHALRQAVRLPCGAGRGRCTCRAALPRAGAGARLSGLEADGGVCDGARWGPRGAAARRVNRGGGERPVGAAQSRATTTLYLCGQTGRNGSSERKRPPPPEGREDPPQGARDAEGRRPAGCGAAGQMRAAAQRPAH